MENQHFFPSHQRFLLKKILRQLISRIFSSVIAFYSTFPHILSNFRESSVFPKEELISRNFCIADEVTMFEGENWSDKSYAVAGDILDGYMYDLFMNMLGDRGIDKHFAEKLSNYCSAYEHRLYITMLEDMKKFMN